MSARAQREKTQCFALLCKSSGPLRTRMLEEAYGKVVMKKTQLYEWHKSFHVIVNEDPPCMRPSTSIN
jgi:hypothetical protein